MNRKVIIEKLLKEGFSEKTLVSFNDKQLALLSTTILKEEDVMISKKDPQFQQKVAIAKKGNKTIETYESKHEDVNEKWDGDVKIKKTGEHADKTVKELKTELNKLKEKSKKYQDEGKKVPKKIIDQEAELKFAIRAKQGWKEKINENNHEIEEWVLDLAESKYTHFTSKNDIMKIINEKMETFQPMPISKAKKGHNDVPEFMTYDAIVGNQPSPAPNPSQPDVIPDTPTKPEERPRPKTPYQPGPGVNPKPKALFEKEKEAPVKPKTPVKPKERPKTPYQPGPGTNPKPKALFEKEKESPVRPKTSKMYYHVLEDGGYGNIGWHGYYDTEKEAEERVSNLQDKFPKLFFYVEPSNSKKETYNVTV
jgi:hypothetical protein